MKPKVWIIDHCAERLSVILNQPVEPPHPSRRKGEKKP